jgi:glycosyltransferase involved in cell wall biosynthesis
MKKILSDQLVLLQTVAPDYRKRFFDALSAELKDNFFLYSGEDYFEESVKTDKKIQYLKNARNYYFFNRRLLFQFGMWSDALTTKNLVLELNPRILSNWLLLIFRKLLNKRSILWGHVWPTKGQFSRTEKIRNFMRRLADVIVAYTREQADDLQKKMPNKKIVFAPNALYLSEEMHVGNASEIFNVIFVGRLTKAKKPQILVEAFNSIIKKIPKEANLIIIGEGPEKNRVSDLVKKLKINDRVSVLGHVGDYNTLSRYYSQSLFSVSPGYVGLSITQSFGFGVPMLISKNENHSPEIEAAEIGVNSEFFITDDKESLASNILDFYIKQDLWIKRRKLISEKCKNTYSIERMAQTFLDIVSCNNI